MRRPLVFSRGPAIRAKIKLSYPQRRAIGKSIVEKYCGKRNVFQRKNIKRKSFSDRKLLRNRTVGRKSFRSVVQNKCCVARQFTKPPSPRFNVGHGPITIRRDMTECCNPFCLRPSKIEAAPTLNRGAGGGSRPAIAQPPYFALSK